MDQPLAVMGTPGIGFLSLIVLGGLAGWIAGMIVGSRHWLFTNILIGIAGSYIGSNLARVLNFGLVGSIDYFVAALAGSVILLIVWRALHPAQV
ncbi:GlsB/YeaQ/YmgE family stress response membrane protein [Lichenihabitans sp. PAMC28606]|uniref:GlsB/YeaQ/YmgE family stress response membrane protein n=1 Tax=Lichenihabitans sp. PAMC28606 TaxID=2880932 RepID=UPI001D0B7E4D|nr:GlsB/YeaQ/YmgE family stress response membrane protein [Lichenihabitans sp. PAMC28606]UDL95345.1 GlsB/YeaQ/YmgE family stress response membrane protein [Lichenihabitans sp. PAMC28606]